MNRVEIRTADEFKGHGQVLKTACDACPFSRKIGTDLKSRGNPDPTVYVGQAYGPFWLPCHKDAGFNAAGKCNQGPDIAQCGGAAVFRANVGIADKFPDAFLRLPADTETVFASAAELIAHHLQIPLAEAEEFLASVPPEVIAYHEILRSRFSPSATLTAIKPSNT